MAIGVFDSGLGGLTVVRQIRRKYPRERILYYGDTLRVPYGGRKPEELIRLADQITGFLVDQGAELIVDACNTTSALAVDYLIEKYGHRAEIIGVVGPGASRAARVASCRVGLMATEATVASGVYQNRILTRNDSLSVVTQACPRLVPFIEEGDLDSYMVREALEAYLEPLMEQQVDALILGCTHYPFLRPLIEEITGGAVSLIDPAEEVIQRIGDYAPGDEGESVCYVSARVDSFREISSRLLPEHGFGRFLEMDVVEDMSHETKRPGCR